MYSQVLDIYRLHDGEYVDATGGVKEPFERVVQILNRTQDVALLQRYGIWVLKHDPALGLKASTTLLFNQTPVELSL
jgi:hypothetical protein